MSAVAKMRQAGFLPALSPAGGLLIEPASRLSAEQRAYIRAHKVLLLEELRAECAPANDPPPLVVADPLSGRIAELMALGWARGTPGQGRKVKRCRHGGNRFRHCGLHHIRPHFPLHFRLKVGEGRCMRFFCGFLAGRTLQLRLLAHERSLTAAQCQPPARCLPLLRSCRRVLSSGR